MPDIDLPINYSSELKALIKIKLNDPLFSHKNWSDDELQDFRITVRDYYRKKQKGNCAFCMNPISLQSANNCNVEHIVPKSKRLEFIFEPKNLCVICADCNEIKRNQETEIKIPDTLTKGDKAIIYPRSSNAFLIVHPHFDIWEHHIIKFGDLYADLSDKGAFTIRVCILNRKLREFGWEAIIADEADLRIAAESWLKAPNNIIGGRWLQILKRLLITV